MAGASTLVMAKAVRLDLEVQCGAYFFLILKKGSLALTGRGMALTGVQLPPCSRLVSA